ncbi:MAG: adenosylhomocysteinase [Candidatus Nitrosocosmicus sp.]
MNDNIDLIEQGEQEFFWAKDNMPIIEKILKKCKNKKILERYSLGICLHITKETAVLVMGLKHLGANIFLCPANPLSTQEHIVSFLKEKGIDVYGKKGETIQTFYNNMHIVLDKKPNFIIDDGGEFHNRALQKNYKIFGGTEETTSGINRLKAWYQKKIITYPIIAVNQSNTKYLFDNRYGTGQSSIEGILRTTGILLAGKRVIVCGYGWVGKGIASCLKGLGAKVIITEIDPLRGLEAFMDGFEVKPISETTLFGDLYITCTGQLRVIRQEHIEKMKNGVILCNAGHFDVEIDINYLNTCDFHPTIIRKNLKCYKISKKKIYLLSEGRVINLVGSDGNPPEIMSLSFANQLLSIIYLSKHYKKLENKIYKVPKKIENEISRLALQSFNIKIDNITLEQENYFYN